MVGDYLSTASPATLTLSSGRSRLVKYCSQVLAYPGGQVTGRATQPKRRYDRPILRTTLSRRSVSVSRNRSNCGPSM